MLHRTIRQANYFRKNYSPPQPPTSEESKLSCTYGAINSREFHNKMSTYIPIIKGDPNHKIRELVKVEIEKEFGDSNILEIHKKRKSLFSIVIGFLFFIVLLYERPFKGLHLFYGKG